MKQIRGEGHLAAPASLHFSHLPKFPSPAWPNTPGTHPSRAELEVTQRWASGKRPRTRLPGEPQVPGAYSACLSVSTASPGSGTAGCPTKTHTACTTVRREPSPAQNAVLVCAAQGARAAGLWLPEGTRLAGPQVCGSRATGSGRMTSIHPVLRAGEHCRRPRHTRHRHNFHHPDSGIWALCLPEQQTEQSRKKKQAEETQNQSTPQARRQALL